MFQPPFNTIRKERLLGKYLDILVAKVQKKAKLPAVTTNLFFVYFCSLKFIDILLNMQLRNRHGFFLLIAGFLATFSSCAKISAPTGGPKDSTPPKVTYVDPADGTVHFREKQISIHFDEYVTLDNPSENVLISPPMASPPEYTLKGKSVVVKFKDTLRDNTTYNIIFSNAVKDFHEGNPLDYFHYSFATGDSLDDYMIRGNILDAKTLAPAKDMFVLLYDGDEDSLPLTSLPLYVTKSLSDGSFTLKNIRKGDYKIFAIKDINANLLYDLPNEEIAFTEESVKAFRALPDSAADSLKAQLPILPLFSFVASDTAQKLSRYENPAPGIYKFPYKMRIDHFAATPLSQRLDYFEQINPGRDTVTWYLKSQLADTVDYLLTADSHIDTVRLTPFREKAGSGRGKTPAARKLQPIFTNAGEYHKPLTLRFPYPILPTDSFSVWVYSQQQDTKDTTLYRYAVPDTFTLQLPLPMSYTEKKSYSIMIPDSIFFDYNGLTNDTLTTQFSTKSLKDYGTLIMNYEIPDNGKCYIATLWLKDRIIQEDILKSSKTVTYKYLNPETYRISVFCDENRNGRWDPGNYSKRLQPEKMYAFPHNVSIRAYWDSEETLTIEP